ncbi:XRE family transcriptional regulator [Pseudomonas sp. ICMP 460]|uniref:LexA family transcriptional regulator n=1 Tax=Pseudomonas sp. ICMP 460 TaxID=1718917 RepID=UPI000C07D4CA|nr:XRE family transcriptional regulator [Pseudomonas sp. ICMP 460]PHN32205.1 peptidase S24 [Pseudomonas sp. ICMP 460]
MKNPEKAPAKKRALSAEELAECAALNAIYKAKKKSLGISQEKIAMEGLKANSQSAASHYLTGRNALNIEAAAVFARYLQVPVSDFSERLAREIKGISRSSESNVEGAQQPGAYYRYPVISWVSAGSWAEAVEPYPAGVSDRYEYSEYNSKGPAFWLEVKGDSMTSPVGTSIAQGSLILVDTEVEATPGKLVVAKLPDSNEATFKKLVSDGGRLYLKPLNPGYPTEVFDENCRIVGVVVQATQKFHY